MPVISGSSGFTRGETCRVALKAEGESIVGDTCRMTIKAAHLGQPPGDAVAGVSLTVTQVAHVDEGNGASPPGWIGVLSADDSEALAKGIYFLDARVVRAAGDVAQTSLVRLTVDERVTEPA